VYQKVKFNSLSAHIRSSLLSVFQFEIFIKSLEIVMPDVRSLSRTTMRGHPEGIEFSGFRLSPE
jgi:hypothetical protein